MTKSELMSHLAEKYLAQGHSRLAVKDVEQSVKVLVDAMTRALARGQRIEIRGFGSFDLNHRPARIGRNPKTGEEVPITARRVVTFHASQKLKGMVEHYYDKQRQR